MSQPNSIMKFALPVLVIAFVVIGFAMYSSEPEPVTHKVEPVEENNPPPKPDAMTIGNQWNWQNVTLQRKAKAEALAQSGAEEERLAGDFPYTPEQIYQALENVRLDQDGNLVLDYITLAALHNSLGSTSAYLSDEHLAVLKDIIQIGLSGPAGEQAAELVGNFHEYLKAQSDLLQLNSTPQSTAEQRKQYEEIQVLRTLYLGDEVTKGLFGQSDTDADMMIRSMEIDAMQDLSPEEKTRQQQALVDQHIADTMAVHGLGEKYRRFVSEREQIFATYQDETERTKQVQAALYSHFTQQELAAIQHLPIVNP